MEKGNTILKQIDLLLYQLYSFGNNLINVIQNLLPPIIRNILFKIFLGKLGKRVLIDYGVYFRYPRKIFISDNVEINRGCEFYPSFRNRKARITIENNVLIAPKVIFFGAGHELYSLNHISDNILVRENSYIGGGTIIRYGTVIGKNCVIGAGSVVIGNIPDNSFAAGNPARIIKKI